MIEKKKVNLLEQTTHVRLCGFSIHWFFLFYSFFFAERHLYLAIRNSNRVGIFLPRNNPSIFFCLEFQVRTRLITMADACCLYAASAVTAKSNNFICTKQKYSLDWFSPCMIDWLIFLSHFFLHSFFFEWYSLWFGFILFFRFISLQVQV